MSLRSMAEISGGHWPMRSQAALDSCSIVDARVSDLAEEDEIRLEAQVDLSLLMISHSNTVLPLPVCP
jgi:hypothetical protein